MPNGSGVWTLSQQFQAKGQGLWPQSPGAPTIGTATAGVSLCASVTFTAPGCTGYPAGITGYTVTSTPGCITKTGSSSPITVTGLTCGTSYTFKVKAQNASGFGPCSAASNSVKAAQKTCSTYTTPGTYTWFAPSGVTSVAAVAIGGGGGGRGWSYSPNGAAGGGLSYINALSVTPGCGYTVVVGAGGTGGSPNNSGTSGGISYFVNTSTLQAVGGGSGGQAWIGQIKGTAGYNGGTGGGGLGYCGGGGGGGGGYAGNGGAGGNGGSSSNGSAGSGGGGGGGGGGQFFTSYPYEYHPDGGSGGGVGIFGQGSNGSGGAFGGSSGGAGSGGSGQSYGGGGGGGGGTYICCPCFGNRWVSTNFGGSGGGGAVRIVWAGGSRGTPSFPSTNVGA